MRLRAAGLYSVRILFLLVVLIQAQKLDRQLLLHHNTEHKLSRLVQLVGDFLPGQTKRLNHPLVQKGQRRFEK